MLSVRIPPSTTVPSGVQVRVLFPVSTILEVVAVPDEERRDGSCELSSDERQPPVDPSELAEEERCCDHGGDEENGSEDSEDEVCHGLIVARVCWSW